MNFNLPTPELVIENTNQIALIDADYLKYIVTYRISKEIVLDQSKPTPEYILVEQIDRILEEVLMGIKAKARVFIFSGKTKDNFRYAIAQQREYKGTRKKKDLLYRNVIEDMAFVVNYIATKEHTIFYAEYEADDLLCVLQDEDTFIYSKDKDMLQIPGMHYNIKTQEFFIVTEDDAWEFLMAQTLTGDSTDNIGGLNQFGPAKVNKLFEVGNVDTRLKQVIETYMSRLGRRRGLDAFVENYSLVRLTMNRGEYLKSKLGGAIQLINTLKLVR